MKNGVFWDVGPCANVDKEEPDQNNVIIKLLNSWIKQMFLHICLFDKAGGNSVHVVPNDGMVVTMWHSDKERLSSFITRMRCRHPGHRVQMRGHFLNMEGLGEFDPLSH
jgi:hypothetical protein